MSQPPKDDLSVLQLFAILAGVGCAVCSIGAVFAALCVRPLLAGQFFVYAFWSGIVCAVCVMGHAAINRKS